MGLNITCIAVYGIDESLLLHPGLALDLSFSVVRNVMKLKTYPGKRKMKRKMRKGRERGRGKGKGRNGGKGGKRTSVPSGGDAC